MLTILLVLILLILLFGAVAIRGAIAKILMFVSLSIAGALLIGWFGEDGFTALLWIGLGLLAALWATVQFLNRPKPSPRKGQHKYVSMKPENPDPATIQFSSRRPGKAERKRISREYRERQNMSSGET